MRFRQSTSRNFNIAYKIMVDHKKKGNLKFLKRYKFQKSRKRNSMYKKFKEMLRKSKECNQNIKIDLTNSPELSNTRRKLKDKKLKSPKCTKTLNKTVVLDDTIIVLSDNDTQNSYENCNISLAKSKQSRKRKRESNTDSPLELSSTSDTSSNNSKAESDEVVVVWSNTKDEYPENSHEIENLENSHEIENLENSKLFIIDKTPDFSHLMCLKSDEHPKKKRKTASKLEELRNIHNKKNNVNSRSVSQPLSNSDDACWLKWRNSETNNSDNNKPSCSYASDVQNTCETKTPKKLREIIIDGNNIAMTYTKGKSFSEEGLKLVIDYFQKRGHSVKAFVPQHKRSRHRNLLEQLYLDDLVVFTPSRSIDGKNINPYDDRYILEYATKCNGIVVSSDQYRDLYRERPEWRDTIKYRLLTPTFVGNYVMFPQDPLGRYGPTLDQFLCH